MAWLFSEPGNRVYPDIPLDGPDTYKEIQKLDKMLTEANIPHCMRSGFLGGYQIVYNGHNVEPTEKPIRQTVCDVIEHTGSYGNEKDLLEISGLMTEEEMEEHQDTVLGYLTAENVFNRIKKHWDETA